MSNNVQKNRYGITVSAADVLREFWRAIKPYKWPFFADVGILVLNACVQVFVPIFYKRFFDTLTGPQGRTSGPELIRIITIILFLNTFIWVAFRIGTFIYEYLQAHVMATLRQNAFKYMIGHSYSFFANNFTGSLVQRVNRFARAFERLSDRFFWNIIPLVINVIGASIVVWQIDSRITVIIVFWVSVFFGFNYFFSKWKLKYNVAMAEADSYTTAILSDNITNHNAIQLFTNSNYENKTFSNATDKQAKITNLAWSLGSVVDSVQSGLLVAVEFLLFYFAIKYWQAGSITVGSFVLIQVYFIGLGSRLWDLSRIIRDTYEGFADSKEMVEIMRLPQEIKDMPGAEKLSVRSGKIEFRNVSFSFNQTRAVLSNLNLAIAGGEKVALVGPSGAGKSTFVRLILRLYDVAGGTILIDGQNIQHVTQKSLRENIGFVPQDPVLFHRTLKENIRYGKLDATDEEVVEAARSAHCDEFINGLPQGYETYVGERGIKLSGGERQRVAIARAILKNAPILVLDEATSSLDSGSEHLIQDALTTLMKGKTVIVIAHRLSTIRKMDRIVVLDKGAILEEGTHETLLEKAGSLYNKLWKLQAGGFLKTEEF